MKSLFLFATAETRKMRLFWPCLFLKRWEFGTQLELIRMQVETNPSGDSFLPPPQKKNTARITGGVFGEHNNNASAEDVLKCLWLQMVFLQKFLVVEDLSSGCGSIHQ